MASTLDSMETYIHGGVVRPVQRGKINRLLFDDYLLADKI